ncbi:hypothetical protein ACVW0P_003345 [Mucilaginibacter sp. UYNi724]
MEPIIKYISLLLFSGLILPFYNSSTHKNHVLPHTTKTALASNKTRAATPGHAHSFIYQDIAEILFPQLIN